MASSGVVYKQDAKTTYCYYMQGVKYTADLSSVKAADITSQGVGAECPVQLSVTVPAKVNAGSIIPLSLKAVINEKNVPANFQFTLPISKALVPESLRATSNNESGSLATTQFDVAVANFVICDYRSCDIFTDRNSFSGNYFPSSNNPKNFDTRVATFGSTELAIPKESKYTGFAHIVLSVAGLSRSDYVTYFPVQVGELPGTAPSSSLSADSKTTYCWTSKDTTPFDARIDDTSITVRTNANCPGTMLAAVSKSSVNVGETVNVDFSMQLESARDPTTIVGEVSPTAAIRDPTSGVYSMVPVAMFSSCLQNAENTKSPCSTYSGPNSRTQDIQSWTNQNLTSGSVTFSSSHSFDAAGQYLLISRVVMQTIDGDRLDMAVYSTIQVTIPASSSGSMFLYLGLGMGALILLLGFLFCFMRKRRQRNKMKQIPFRTPVPGGGPHERSSQYTTTSSNFVTHRSPQMHTFPIAYPQHENNAPSFYSVDKESRNDSFSLDPYRRNSFNEMSEDENNNLDMTIRPSDASKFSFQTGYDDQSDWEYDQQSFRNRGHSDFSDDRGTFNLHPSGALPIMEEDERRYKPTNYNAQNNTNFGWNMRT